MGFKNCSALRPSMNLDADGNFLGQNENSTGCVAMLATELSAPPAHGLGLVQLEDLREPVRV